MEINEKTVKYLIDLELRSAHVKRAKSDVDALYAAFHRLLQENAELAKNSELAAREIAILVRNHIEGMKRAADKTAALKKGIKSVSNEIGSLTGRVASLVTKLTSLSMVTSGFVQMKEEATEYNNQLRSLSTTVAKYGVSVSNLEAKLDNLAKTTHLTRRETMELLRGYEQSVRAFTLEGFERTLRQIQKAVGPNATAIREMMDVITTLTREKMPDLERAIQNIDRGGNATRVREASRLLLLTGDISQAEFKRIQEYIRGSAQMSNADKLRIAQIERQQESVKKFEASIEQIRLSIGRALLPMFESLGDWFARNSDQVERFFNAVAGGAESVADILDVVINKFGLLSAMALAAAPVVLGRASPIAGTIGAMASGIGGGVMAGFGGDPRRTRMQRAMGLDAADSVGGKFLKSGGALRGGLTGAVAGLGLGYAADAAQEAGYTRTSGALDVAGGAATVAGMASIGSFLGPVGVAAGALLGLALSADELVLGFKKLVGWTEETVQKDPMAERIAAAKESATKEVQSFLSGGPSVLTSAEQELANEVRDRSEAAVKAALAKPLDAGSILAAMRDSRNAEAALGMLAAAFERSAAAKGIGEEQLQAAEDRRNRVSTAIDEARVQERYAMSRGDQQGVIHYQTIQQELARVLEQEELRVEEILRARAELEKQTTEYRETKIAAESALAVEMAISAQIEMQRAALEKVKQLRGSSLNLLQTELALAQITGGAQDIRQVDVGVERQRSVNEYVLAQLDQMVSLQEAISQGVMDEVRGRKQIQNISERLAQSENGVVSSFFAEIGAAANLNELLALRNEIAAETYTLYQKQLEAVKGLQDVAASNVRRLQAEVSLLDNYALGVGASAELRQEVVDALDQEIRLLKMRENIIQQEIAAGRDIAQNKAALANIEADILEKQTAQASLIKSIRDGFISAIGAMNTGAGRFAKIMVSQNEAAGSLIRMFDGAQTFTTGAIQGGWRSGLRVNTQGQFVGDVRESDVPYQTIVGGQAYGTQFKLRDVAARDLGDMMQRRAGEVAASQIPLAEGLSKYAIQQEADSGIVQMRQSQDRDSPINRDELIIGGGLPQFHDQVASPIKNIDKNLNGILSILSSPSVGVSAQAPAEQVVVEQTAAVGSQVAAMGMDQVMRREAEVRNRLEALSPSVQQNEQLEEAYQKRSAIVAEVQRLREETQMAGGLRMQTAKTLEDNRGFGGEVGRAKDYFKYVSGLWDPAGGVSQTKIDKMRASAAKDQHVSLIQQLNAKEAELREFDQTNPAVAGFDPERAARERSEYDSLQQSLGEMQSRRKQIMAQGAISAVSGAINFGRNFVNQMGIGDLSASSVIDSLNPFKSDGRADQIMSPPQGDKVRDIVRILKPDEGSGMSGVSDTARIKTTTASGTNLTLNVNVSITDTLDEMLRKVHAKIAAVQSQIDAIPEIGSGKSQHSVSST